MTYNVSSGTLSLYTTTTNTTTTTVQHVVLVQGGWLSLIEVVACRCDLVECCAGDGNRVLVFA